MVSGQELTVEVFGQEYLQHLGDRQLRRGAGVAAHAGIEGRLKVEQSQRALNLGQAFGAHVEVAGGGVERGVTQERLDDGDLDAVLQAVGGEAVAQAVDAAAVGQSGLGDGAVEDASGRCLC